MIIFGSSLSPFVRKTMIFAAEKGIEYENRVTPPGRDPDPDFAIASPFRKIPALKDGDFNVCDSSAIIAYFDALQPGGPDLIPAEPRLRARTVWFEEFADTILMPAGARIFFNRFVSPTFLGQPGDEAVAAKAETEELPPLYDYLEDAIGPSGFLVGDRFTLADIAVASPFATLNHINVGPKPESHPKLVDYVRTIWARPSFAELIAREQQLLAAVAQRAAGKTTQ